MQEFVTPHPGRTPEPTENYSCTVLRECIELQRKKAHDYQNANSSVKQIDYY
jgi:hypothetical protein